MSSVINLYAKSLLEATADLSKKEMIAVVDRWLRELANKNLLNKIPEIISKMEKLDDQTEGIIRAKITMARKLSKGTLEEISKFIAKRTGAKQVIFSEIIDPQIGGGFIINFNDTILDASLLGRTQELADSIGN